MDRTNSAGMEILVPVDGSDRSERVLGFAATLANRFEAGLHVVHFSDNETDATDTILDRAREALAVADLDDEPELVRMDAGVRNANNVGEAILDLVEERGYDHVVMGHDGEGTVGRAILGSAAETVVRAERVPVTIIPTGDGEGDGGEN